MPNTLAHIGVQGFATRGLLQDADLKWIYLGCIVPDIPWIGRRLLGAVVPEAWAYDLVLYATVQSALFMCLVLAAAFSTLSARSGRVFIILAIGSFMHLLLDALQTKWANGVHLFAPFSWELLNFGLFWPEDYQTLILTGLGLVYFAYAWWRLPCTADDLIRPGRRRLALGAVSLLAYVLVPLALLSGPEAADNHSVKSLREVADRRGREVAFDRERYEPRAGGGVLYTFAGEELQVVGLQRDRPGDVSARGRFLDEDTVFIEDLHAHQDGARDFASYVGLLLVLAFWIRSLLPRLAARARQLHQTRGT